ncbi:hypothetical protein, partial [Alicyclobacillus fastidiosus]|uniref:hypothetical protein n=1 Tax=Alicyclobacillus fastidiosus TaxID=392011 RepID=UPI0024E0E27B
YNFKPLIDAALALYDKDEPSGPVENEWKVRYQKPCVPEVRTGKIEPDVPRYTGLEVRTDTRPEVRTKRTSIKTTKSKIKSNRTTTKEPSNSTKAANAKAKHDTKRIVVVVDSEIDDLGFEIESKGAPIRTLMPMLSQWLKEHGREYIIEKAEIIQGGDWNNPLGAFRKAVEEDWPVIGKKAQTKSSDDDDDFARAEDEWYERSRQSLSGKSSTQHDSRYENFYKLFPDS